MQHLWPFLQHPFLNKKKNKNHHQLRACAREKKLFFVLG